MLRATLNERMEEELMEDHRRSVRLPLDLPVYVYGRTPDNKPFRDLTRTLAVSAHGGLLALSAPARLKCGQTLLLVNSFTQEERRCRVVYVGRRQSTKRKVGVEFLDRVGDFWHVYTPLTDPDFPAPESK